MKLKSFFTFTIFFVATPFLALAQERMTFIESIPFMNGAAATSTEDYVSALYMIAISVAAILVVIRIIIAGVKYMLSESVSDKVSAKEDIEGALLGLLVILGAATILNTINPQLTRTDIFRNVEPAAIPASNSTNRAASPVQQNTKNTCSPNTVWMECVTASGVDSRCSAVGDKSWCQGNVEIFE